MMKKQTHSKPSHGLRISRYFTQKGSSVFSQFEFEKRKSSIRNPNGTVVFEMNGVEVPTSWSQVATDILAQKYFRKAGVPQADGTLGSENSIKQVVNRMAGFWRSHAEKYGYFASKQDAQHFEDEIKYCLLSQMTAPNSPQWFNSGLYDAYGISGKAQGHFYVEPETGMCKASTSAFERPQVHACFILSVKDDLVNEGGIMDLFSREARIFKYGSGSGTNYSDIRGRNEKLSGGGHSSGLMSFLKIGDRAAGAIKSGGTTRRAAKMVTIDADHPEILEFVRWKAGEEKKAAALIAAGFSGDFEGEAFQTVSGQNSNNSVRIPNSFFKALESGRDWELKGRADGKTISVIRAIDLWNEIAKAAWECADPGVQFDSTINEWHTCPKGGKIKASNPCSEFMFLDDTACNLASVNLKKFWNREEKQFDTEAFQHVCRLWTIVLEVSVLAAQYPSAEIAKMSFAYRPLGLGFANLGSMLMSAGIGYDSEEGKTLAAGISALMTATVYKTSSEMAEVLGPFEQFAENRDDMLRVIRNHRFAAYHAQDAFEGIEVNPLGIDSRFCPANLLKAACDAWDQALQLGEKFGYRNAQASVIAPTGTIGLLMDCDTTGIEPDFALVKFKKLSGGGYFKIVNQSVAEGLETLGYEKQQQAEIIRFITGNASFQHSPHINHETLKAKGFSTVDIERAEELTRSAIDLRFVFSPWNLGEDCMKRLGVESAVWTQSGFDLLEYLGFSELEIQEANDFVCGHQTVEGAPGLQEKDYFVFDCANRCGPRGKRFLTAESHLYMMAAVQQFISGAISKTVNLPHEVSQAEIAKVYEMAWKLGLKSCALYRDGSKQAQPLVSRKRVVDEKVESPKIWSEKEVLDAAQRLMAESADTQFKRQLSGIVERKKLPGRRKGFTQKVKIGGHTVFIRTGEYNDGTLGEIFIDMHKEGAAFRSLLNCFAIAISIGLQYGVPLEEYVDKFTFTRFEPSGVSDHPNIKTATSVVDFIFRLLGYEYLQRNDLVHLLPEEPNFSDPKPSAQKHETIRKTSMILAKDQSQDYLGQMMGDAPICETCGHLTVRSGTCYRCLNCGSSLGCS